MSGSHSKQVLLVDDNPAFLRSLENVISTTEGLELADSATSGVQALQILQQIRFDVMITDLCMPGMNGVELITKARQQTSAMKIILVSLQDDQAYEAAALTAGADLFLPKAELLDALHPSLLDIFSDLKISTAVDT